MNLRGDYAEWKNPVTKDCILYNSVYMKFSEKTKLEWQRPGQWVPWARGKEQRLATNGYEETFWSDGRVLKLGCGDSCANV